MSQVTAVTTLSSTTGTRGHQVQYWEHPGLGPPVTVSDMVGNGGIDTLLTVERIISQ